jgi:biotin carboxylase
MRAKNKPLMRRRLAGMGIEDVTATEIRPGDGHTVSGLAYPVVLKPAEGVASEDVILVLDPDELREQCALIFARRPGEVLLAEQYLPGGLRTLETLSDGVTTWVLGGFRTRVSPRPYFVEERLTWDVTAPDAASEHVTRALAALGATFGACHTEYVLDPGRPPALIEVNDRLIGDHCDFLLSDLLGTDLFDCLLRLYLGEPLPPGPPPRPAPGRAHAVIDYDIAERPGVLVASPKAGAQPSSEPGVLLCYRPLREEGDRVDVTRTNLDYLGAVTAIGPDAAAVDRAVAALRATEHWEITEPAR